MPALLATDRLDLSAHERDLLWHALQSSVRRFERYAQHAAEIGSPGVAKECLADAEALKRIVTKLGMQPI
jgi:hypothetical protein